MRLLLVIVLSVFPFISAQARPTCQQFGVVTADTAVVIVESLFSLVALGAIAAQERDAGNISEQTYDAMMASINQASDGLRAHNETLEGRLQATGC